MRDWLLTEVDSFSTLPQWSVATTRWKSFKVIHGQVENLMIFCFYFTMMICCCWWISVLQGHLGTGGEHKEKIFILCDDDLLLLPEQSPSRKLMDRWRTEGENISTLRWWSIAANRCESFKQIYGQVENRRRNWFYFGLMICFGNQMPLRIRHSTISSRLFIYLCKLFVKYMCFSFKNLWSICLLI